MPFISGRSTFQRITGALATTPMAPTIGTITASINSPNKIDQPTVEQTCNDATFSWNAPSVGGSALSVPFTAPSFSGGLPITDYQYSTDNGATWKSSGSTVSPIAITTVSSSSSQLSPGTSYTVRLRAVNALGTGQQTSGSTASTPSAITSYTVRVYDNYPTEDELVETVTGHSTTSIIRSHFKVERDWTITVAAVNSNGTGTYSDESAKATGWRYTGYDADYSTTRSCTTGSGCSGCGTKTGTEDGTVDRTCYQWTRSGCTSETGLDCVTGSTTWNGNCRDTGACSGSWSSFEASSYTGPVTTLLINKNTGGDPRYIELGGYYFGSPTFALCTACDCYYFNADIYFLEKCNLYPANSTDPAAYRWVSHECFFVSGP